MNPVFRITCAAWLLTAVSAPVALAPERPSLHLRRDGSRAPCRARFSRPQGRRWRAGEIHLEAVGAGERQLRIRRPACAIWALSKRKGSGCSSRSRTRRSGLSSCPSPSTCGKSPSITAASHTKPVIPTANPNRPSLTAGSRADGTPQSASGSISSSRPSARSSTARSRESTCPKARSTFPMQARSCPVGTRGRNTATRCSIRWPR